MDERQKRVLFYSSLFVLASATDLLATMVFMSPNHIGEQNGIANTLLREHGILAVAAIKTGIALGGAAIINIVAHHNEPHVRSIAESAALAAFAVTLAMPLAWIGAEILDSNQETIANFVRMSATALRVIH